MSLAKQLQIELKLTAEQKVKANRMVEEFIGSKEQVEYACGHVIVMLQRPAPKKPSLVVKKTKTYDSEIQVVLVCKRCDARVRRWREKTQSQSSDSVA
jgi:phosphoribosylformimino-5-aminoimidazole carboxamide ribonucleotide (ProFAR) isomerase